MIHLLNESEPVAALGNRELQRVAIAAARVILHELLPQRAHSHAHQRVLGTVEGGIFAENVVSDLRFLRRIVAQGALEQVGQQLAAAFGFTQLLRGEQPFQVGPGPCGVDVNHGSS